MFISLRPRDRKCWAHRQCPALSEGPGEQPLPALSSEAIDFRAASESFAPFRMNLTPEQKARLDIHAARVAAVLAVR